MKTRRCRGCGAPIGKYVQRCDHCRVEHDRARHRALPSRLKPCEACGKKRRSRNRPLCMSCSSTRSRTLSPCPRCGTMFWPWANQVKHARKYCGCPIIKRPKPVYIPVQPWARSCEWCSVEFSLNRVSRFCSRVCRQRYFNKRRKLKMRGLTPQVISAKRLWVRDNGVCGLCGQVVDQAHVYPHPMAATVDHIVPISKGGSQSESNLQLAHARCNTSKGNRAA